MITGAWLQTDETPSFTGRPRFLPRPPARMDLRQFPGIVGKGAAVAQITDRAFLILRHKARLVGRSTTWPSGTAEIDQIWICR